MAAFITTQSWLHSADDTGSSSPMFRIIPLTDAKVRNTKPASKLQKLADGKAFTWRLGLQDPSCGGIVTAAPARRMSLSLASTQP
ncbi:hypothetical protein LL240_02480 [Oceanimonas baumannii]|nr:hypothetical protein [Oceanimonas baumannii]MCC4263329.1 hypothetical protein [Oceanimonas baumannii]